MSECVVRMEMPKRCAECPLSCQMYGDTPCYCKVAFEEKEAVEGGLMWKETDPTKRPSWCPIVCQLPEGHGRLVDISPLDVIAFRDKDDSFYAGVVSVCERIDKLPTIVPADTAERSET